METLMNAFDAARLLGVSANALAKLRVSGGGPEFVHVGRRRVRYEPSVLRAWINANRRGSTSQGGA